MYGGEKGADEKAMKAALHEMKGLEYFFATGIKVRRRE